MRLFTGISIGTEVRERLKTKVDPSRVNNLHITTKFIGEWREEHLPDLKQALGTVKFEPFSVTVRDFGAFSHSLYACVHADSELAALAARTEDVCEVFGIPREERPYFPHVTLARTKGRLKSLPLGGNFGTFAVSSFHLYLSRASQYTALETYPAS